MFKRIIYYHWFWGILLTFISTPLVAASFNCTKATTEVEKMICDPNNHLGEDDEQIGDLYSQLLKLLPPSQADQLQEEQRDWLIQRDFCLENKHSLLGCLAQKYDERLASLFVLYLQTLLSIKDQEQLSHFIAYPIKVQVDGKETTLHDKQQFLANYSKIITKAVKTALLNQDPAHVFSNWRGKMIGQGEIWFRGTQIVAINNDDDPNQVNMDNNNNLHPVETNETDNQNKLTITPITDDKSNDSDKRPIDEVTQACLEKNYSTTGMLECLNQAYDQWDEELKTTFRRLMEQLDKKGQSALKQAQNAWIKYKDAQFDVINNIYNALEGTMWLSIKANAGVDIIKNRTLELQGYLADLRQSGQTLSKMLPITQPLNRCDVWVFVTDKDPKGLNVRSDPKQEIISRIPRNDYEGFTAVHIIDAKEGWVRIDQWKDPYTEVKINKEAWIYGKLVGTFVKGYQQGWTYAYAAPSKTAQTQNKLLGERQVHVSDCQGKWLFVQGDSVEHHKIEGWLPPDEQCPNAITTCP